MALCISCQEVTTTCAEVEQAPLIYGRGRQYADRPKEEGLAMEKDTSGFQPCFPGDEQGIASSALLYEVKEQRR